LSAAFRKLINKQAITKIKNTFFINFSLI